MGTGGVMEDAIGVGVGRRYGGEEPYESNIEQKN